jgi:PASTA domain
MNPDSMLTCDLLITMDTLSAWRDDLLQPAHAAQLAQHVSTCDACREKIATFDTIASLLRHQRELEPGNRIRRAVHAGIAQQRQRSPFMPHNRIVWGSTATAILLTVIFAVVLRFLANHPTTSGNITVPNFVGQQYGAVKSQAHNLNLQLDVHTVPSTDAQQGEVLTQNPPPSTKVKPGVTVKITVGGGTDFVLVPDVIGKDPTTACSLIENAGLKCIVAAQQVQSTSVAAGLIAKTDPAAGEGISKTISPTVVLYISSGNDTPGPVQNITVQNPAIASGMKVVYVTNNDVWLSIGGSTAQQLTHLNLQGTKLFWSLAWSPDQTKILAVTTNITSSSSSSQGWVISLPAGTVAQLPASATVASTGVLSLPYWINDHLIIYYNPNTPSAHLAEFQVFDTMTQQVIHTPFDTILMPHAPIVANGQLYFVNPSIPNTQCETGVVERYDPATNTMTQFLSLLGSATEQGLPIGGIDVSGDGQTIIAATVGTSSAGCQTNPKYTPIALQRADGTVTPLFTTISQQTIPPTPFLSPDAGHAAIPDSNGFAQENIATKQIYHNQADTSSPSAPYPGNSSNTALATWFGKATPGLYEEVAQNLSDGTLNDILLDYVALDSNAAMQPVMKLNVQAAAFAHN